MLTNARCPSSSPSAAGCVMSCPWNSVLKLKDPLPLFEKSRVVIPVVGFSISYRCGHPTPWKGLFRGGQTLNYNKMSKTKPLLRV